MSDPIEDTPADATQEAEATPARKRPKPGERRLQILQTLAAMLQAPGAERVTTAALAAKIGVSEAALYRHFASKAQMFEGLLEFIEQSCLGLLQQIRQSELNAPQQAQQIVLVLLQFAEKNPGMARVMVGDALVLEHERLSQRMTKWSCTSKTFCTPTPAPAATPRPPCWRRCRPVPSRPWSSAKSSALCARALRANPATVRPRPWLCYWLNALRCAIFFRSP